MHRKRVLPHLAELDLVMWQSWGHGHFGHNMDVYFREIVQRDELHACGFPMLAHKGVHQVLTWKSWSISVRMYSFAVLLVSRAIVLKAQTCTQCCTYS